MRRLGPEATLAPGEGLFFEAFVRGELRPCFAVRAPAGLRAFLNVCAHRNQPVATETLPFDGDGLLECRAHGAKYDPADGLCVAGPCVGARLVSVPLVVEDGQLFALDDDAVDDSMYADGE
jgi:nitrite reductase/ring-hydroxylating ferredoxin subunit